MKRRHITSIGFTVLVATFLLVRAIIFLHPSPGDGKQKLYVRFESVEKISPGTRVAFAGKPVGEVVSVNLLHDTIDRKAGSAQIYPYEVVLSIDSSVQVYKTDEIAVKTSGLMGERFIVITPKPFLEGMHGEIATKNDVLYANSSGSADQAIQEISRIAQKVDKTMESLSTLIQENRQNITDTICFVKEASCSLNSMLSNLKKEHFDEKLSTLGDKAIICAEEIGNFSQKCNKSITNNSSFSQFMNDPQLYTTAVLCLNEATTLINDINRYGIFFHTNRDFQREMALRNEEIQNARSSTFRLKSRQKFANVQKELFELSSAISETKKKVNEDTEENPELRKELLNNILETQKQLDELHHAVEGLEIGDAS